MQRQIVMFYWLHEAHTCPLGAFMQASSKHWTTVALCQAQPAKAQLSQGLFYYSVTVQSEALTTAALRLSPAAGLLEHQPQQQPDFHHPAAVLAGSASRTPGRWQARCRAKPVQVPP